MTLPDIGRTAAQTWPKVKRAHRRGWLRLGGVATLGIIGTLVAGTYDVPLWFPIVAGIFGVSEIYRRSTASIRAETHKIANEIMQICGFEETKRHFDLRGMRALGLLPDKSDQTYLDRITTLLGPFTVDRTEIVLRTKHGEDDLAFSGLVLTITGLPPQHEMSLIQEDLPMSVRRLRKSMQEHPNKDMHHEKTSENTKLGRVFVFGDARTQDEVVISHEAERNLDLMTTLQARVCRDSETIQALYMGPKFCAAVISSGGSRHRIGGMILNALDFNTEVHAALQRLERSLKMAERIITHTAQTTTPGAT